MKKLFAIIVSMFVIFPLWTQSRLYLEEKVGIQATFSLNDIKKLTFSGGNMTITKFQGNTVNFGLNNIRYLNFSGFITEVSSQAKLTKIGTLLYPNPVVDRLQIRLASTYNKVVFVYIIDVQGRTVFQQKLNITKAQDVTDINLSQLSKGLYICRLQNGKETENIKFLKN